MQVRSALTAVFLAMANAASAGNLAVSNPDSSGWQSSKWAESPTVECRADNMNKEICAVTAATPHISIAEWRAHQHPEQKPGMTSQEPDAPKS
jgi:hypothetical protein